MKILIKSLLVEVPGAAGSGFLYFILSVMALKLAIPPGFASPIWPAAGLALAIVLARGPVAASGVFIGSFFANIVASNQPVPTVFEVDLFLPSFIAVGASLQAIAGSWLIRRYMDWPNSLETQSSVIRFLILSGPCSSFINSTLGNLFLVADGRISFTDFPFGFFTWWLGDTLGILIFTPLILTIQGSNRLWRRRLYYFSLPICLIVASITTLFFKFKENEQDRRQAEFGVIAKSFTTNLDNELKIAEETLYNLRDLMTSGSADRQIFNHFVQKSLEREQNLHALSWNPVVLGAKRREFESYASKSWGEPFQIKERDMSGALRAADSREKYVVVNWIYPIQENREAIGFDVASNSARLKALKQAEATGLPVATEKVTLVQDNKSMNGFLLFKYVKLKKIHIHDPNMPSDGFVVGVFKINQIFEQALSSLEEHRFEVHVFNKSMGLEKGLLYMNVNVENKKDYLLQLQRDIDGKNRFDATPSWIEDFVFANQTWRAVLSKRTDDKDANYLWYSWTFIVSGLSFSSILGAFLLILTGRVSEAETERSKMAEELLAQSIKTNQQLEAEKSELDLRSQELQKANTALTRFTYATSHDLREPLRTIQSYTEIIQVDYNETLPTEGKKCLQNIANGADVLGKRIKALLEYVRLGKSDIIEEEFSIKEIIDPTLKGLKQAIEENGTVVTVGTLGTIKGNPELLQQVAENIIHNAIKFASKVTPEISISEERTSEHVILTVADNGDGVPAENREKAFELFSRLDRKRDSYGVGLALCRQIVELHRGKIWLQDNLPTGTQARFKLPL